MGLGHLPGEENVTAAVDVSADGSTIVSMSFNGLSIVGSGFNRARGYQRWVAIVPEPGTGLLVVGGLLGLAGWRRARA